ncbi:MAG: PKD domain-containing protein [Bacteroidota bacterium]
MRWIILTPALLFLYNTGFSQATFQAKTGNRSWQLSTDWTLTSGTDADGIPDSNDDVIIGRASSVSVSGNASGKSVTMNAAVGTDGANAELIVLSGATLTISSDVSLLQNGASTTSGTSEQLILTVAGTLIVNDDVNLLNTASFSGSGAAGNITCTVSGSVQVSDSLYFSNTSTSACNINFTGTASCGNLRMISGANGSNSFSGGLTCNGALSLSHTGAGSSYTGVNTLSFTATSVITGSASISTTSLDGANSFQALAAVTVNGASGLSLSSGSSSGTAGIDNQVVIGSGNTVGSLSLKALTMASPSTGNTIRNQVILNHGELDLNGNLTLSGSNQLRNQLLWENSNASGLGKIKNIRFSGTVSDLASGSLIRSDAGDNANFTFTFDGTTVRQTIPGNDNWQFKRIVLANTYDTVVAGGTLSRAANRLMGLLTLNDGVILKDNSNALGGTGNDSIRLNGSAALVIEHLSGAFPSLVEYTDASSGSSVVFRNTTASVQQILGGTGSAKKFYSVVLTGSGTKQIQADLSAANIDVETVSLLQGTLGFAAATAFNLRSDVNTPTQTFSADAGTTLNFAQNLSAAPQCKFDFDLNSTVSYTGTGQQIYRMHSMAAGSGKLAVLGNLTLSGTGTKTLADSVSVGRKLSIGTGSVLSIANSAVLTLVSNSSSSAWVAPVNGSITYNTSGKIVVQRYFSFGSGPARYRDFTSPVKGTLLSNWMYNGMILSGFPGSNYPYANLPSCAYRYVESVTGDLDEGFIAPTSTSDSIVSMNGTKFRLPGYRIFIGNNLTLADSGQIQTGTILQQVSYTNGSSSKYDNGWNMIANPYPCAIDWELVQADAANTSFIGDNQALGTSNSGTTTGIGNSFYIFMPQENGYANQPQSYSAYNPVTHAAWYPSGSTMDKVIPAYQAVWVKTRSASASQSWNITFKETHKYDAAGNFHKSSAQTEITRIKLGNGHLLSEIGIHEFENAENGFDGSFDIDRLGDPDSASAYLAFTENGAELPLWVNAIPAGKLNHRQTIKVNLPAADTYEFWLDHAAGLLSNFDCAYLKDLVTGAIVNLKTDSGMSFTTTGPFSGERFELVMGRALPNQQVVTTDPSCYQSDNGLLKVDLRNYNRSAHFVLTDPAGSHRTFEGNLELIKVQLPAGKYLLTDSSSTCNTVDYPISLKDPEEVISSFTLPGSPEAGKEIQLTNQSLGAVHYEWFFEDDQSSSVESNPVHTFILAGEYQVTLTATNSDPSCYSKKTIPVRVHVASPAGVGTTASGSYRIVQTGPTVSIQNPKHYNTTYSLYTTDGKLVNSFTSSETSQVISLPSSNLVYLLVVRSENTLFTKKITF